MARDPSLLPEEMRKREEEVTSDGNGREEARGVFHVPESAGASARPPAIGTAPQAPDPAPQADASRKRRERKPKEEEQPVQEQPPRAKEERPRPSRKQAPEASVPDAGGGVKFSMPKVGKRHVQEITLIPDELRKKPVSTRWPQVVAIVGLALTIPLLGIPWWLVSVRLAETRAATEVVERTHAGLLGRIADAERAVATYRTTARRATALRTLLDEHSAWAPFFDLIESQTLPGMRYESLSVDTNGSVSLAAVAPSLRIAAAQLVAWQNDVRIHDISMSGFGSVTDELGIVRGTQFDIQLAVDPALFQSPPQASDADAAP